MPPNARALSLAEAGKFFDAARRTKSDLFFQFAALTGCRRGEMAGLKRDAVDRDSGVMIVRTSPIGAKPDAVGITIEQFDSDLHCRSRLADAARTDQRDQAVAAMWTHKPRGQGPRLMRS